MLARSSTARAIGRLAPRPAAARAFSVSRPRAIDFGLSDDQQAIQDLARTFTANEIIPKAAYHDETQEFPTEIIKSAHAAGLLNLHVPSANGGPELGLLECALVSEELAYGCSGVQTAMEANGLAQAPVIVAGSDETKQKFLAPMTEEPIIAAYCVSESGSASDVAGISTRAKKEGDKWVINGAKCWITGGSKASWYFVLAKTDPNAPGTKSLTAFVVDAKTEGISTGPKMQNMGQRCSDTREVYFENVVVPQENVLGKEGQGFKVAMAAFDITRPLVAAGAVGLARRAWDEASKYALERKTFGQPIYDHQAVAFMIADMAIGVESSRAMVHKAAWTKDTGGKNTYMASIAKALASHHAVSNANLAVQIFGGAGFNKDAGIEKLYRDAKIFEIYEGTTQIQKLIISRLHRASLG